MGNTSCAALSATRVDQGEPTGTPPPTSAQPVRLDEERTRREAPTLAALLDDALLEGSARIDDEGDARAAEAYLDAITAREGASGGRIVWRGETFSLQMTIC